MADLADLKSFGDDVKDILTNLADLAGKNQNKPETTDEAGVIDELQKLVEEYDHQTDADADARAAAIISTRAALTELLMAAARNPVQLSDAQIREIEAQRNALRNAYGLLLERKAFEPIAKLISDADAVRMMAELAGARQQIQQRRQAKQLLDTMVKVALLGGKIAVALG